MEAGTMETETVGTETMKGDGGDIRASSQGRLTMSTGCKRHAP